MADTFKPSLPYDPEKFVDREEEILQILSLLRQSQPRFKAVVIDGDRGVGKTWLSLHLHRTVLKTQIKGTTSWLFGLHSVDDQYRPEGVKPQEGERFVHDGKSIELNEVLEIIINSLSLKLPPNPDLAEKVNLIRSYIRNHVDDRFALILDSAYESNWSLLEQLEIHFLGELLTLSNFFVIVTGRGRPYPWKIPYLIEPIHFGLGIFSNDQIKEQLKKFSVSSVLSVDDIYEIGAGWPLFTERLANAQNRLEALVAAADIVFTVVSAFERSTVRRYFEALCLLDGFGESEAALMVQVYNQGGCANGRTICNKMNETRMASWRNGRYEINAPILNILRQYLYAKDKDVCTRLHLAAYRHFVDQASDPSNERFRPLFEKLIDTHARALSEAGIKDLQNYIANQTKEVLL